MADEHVGSFSLGLVAGIVVAIIGGYFIGPNILSKTLEEHDDKKVSRKSQLHLQRAQEILSESEEEIHTSDTD